MVDDAEFTSYYGRPIIKAPVWKTPDVPLYLFLGGAAGSSAVLGALADLTGRPALTRSSRLVVGRRRRSRRSAVLVHDLGRPERFLHMLRVFKPTSPLSVGSYILVAVQRGGRGDGGGGAAGLVPAAQAVRRRSCRRCSAGRWRPTPRCCWPTPPCRRGRSRARELPFVFAGSAMAAGGGITMAFTPVGEAGRRAQDGRGRGRDRAGRDAPASRPATASSASRTTRAGPGGFVQGGEGVHRARAPGWHAAGRPTAGRGGRLGRAAGRRLAAHPVRRLRGRHGQRAGPEVHRRPPARAHERPRQRGPFRHPLSAAARTRVRMRHLLRPTPTIAPPPAISGHMAGSRRTGRRES